MNVWHFCDTTVMWVVAFNSFPGWPHHPDTFNMQIKSLFFFHLEIVRSQQWDEIPARHIVFRPLWEPGRHASKPRLRICGGKCEPWCTKCRIGRGWECGVRATVSPHLVIIPLQIRLMFSLPLHRHITPKSSRTFFLLMFPSFQGLMKALCCLVRKP